MKSFTDNQGREWKLPLNVLTVRRVRDKVGVLLTKLCEDNLELLSKLYDDPILLCDVCWSIVEEQAEADGVDVKSFATEFLGDTIGRARKALIEATIDFFDDQETRERMRAALLKIEQIAAKVQTTATEKIEALDVESAAKSVSDFVSSMPALSGSSRGDSLSESSPSSQKVASS